MTYANSADPDQTAPKDLIELGFNYMSTLVVHFVLSPREREGKKEAQEWKWRNRRNENIPPLPLPATRIAGLAQL